MQLNIEEYVKRFKQAFVEAEHELKLRKARAEAVRKFFFELEDFILVTILFGIFFGTPLAIGACLALIFSK